VPVAFEILGKPCDIGERLVDPNSVSRPRSRAPRSWNLLPGRGGEQLLVQGCEARGDLRPAVAAAVCLRASATRKPFLTAGGGAEEGVDERVLVVGRDQPARPSVGDDRRRAMRPIAGRPQAIASGKRSSSGALV
jgi:hypothetical protein